MKKKRNKFNPFNGHLCYHGHQLAEDPREEHIVTAVADLHLRGQPGVYGVSIMEAISIFSTASTATFTKTPQKNDTKTPSSERKSQKKSKGGVKKSEPAAPAPAPAAAPAPAIEDQGPGEDIHDFGQLGIGRWLVQQCRAVGLVHPTPVQVACIPPVLKGE
jgi:hypothetical protein